MQRDKNILICTGGTGGHVLPAINFGNYLISKGYNCSLILDDRGKKLAYIGLSRATQKSYIFIHKDHRDKLFWIKT